MNAIEQINAFLDENPVFYLATVSGDKPRCRPLGLHIFNDGTLYFGVGSFKDVYKQMVANPHVEITTTNKEGIWLRYSGKAVFEDSYDLAEAVIAASPMLASIYNEQTGRKLAMFHLEDAVAELRTPVGLKERLSL